MSEFKELSKEPWTNIEVRRPCPTVTCDCDANSATLADRREHLQLARRPHRHEPRLCLQWRFLQGQDDLPSIIPLQPSWYVGLSLLTLTRLILTKITEFKFTRPMFHPNVYPDGKLCISILHPPGEDEMSGELAAERWSPAQRVESVLISILSLLDDAEPSSPANVDAGVMIRNDPEAYKQRARQDVEASKADIPEGFVMPTQHITYKPPVEDNLFSWSDSEVEDDFDNDSDAEMTFDEDDEDDDEQEAPSDSDD